MIRRASSGQLAARLSVDPLLADQLLNTDWRFVRNGRYLSITYSLIPELW